MCKELYRRWVGCECWGFIGPQTCPNLFKTCLGPRGDIDKLVVEWVPDMCNECLVRFIEEAKEMVDMDGHSDAMAAASASSTYTSPGNSTSHSSSS